MANYASIRALPFSLSKILLNKNCDLIKPFGKFKITENVN